MAGAFGADRRAAVCRELTKTHEEVRRGPLAELVAWAADGVRGEVTLVVAGAPPVAADLAEAVRAVRALTATGSRMRPAVAEVALRMGVAKNRLVRTGAPRSGVTNDRVTGWTCPSAPSRCRRRSWTPTATWT